MSTPDLHETKQLILRRFKAYRDDGFEASIESINQPKTFELRVEFAVGQSEYRLEIHERERSLSIRLRHATGSSTWNTIKHHPFRGEEDELRACIDRLFYIAA